MRSESVQPPKDDTETGSSTRRDVALWIAFGPPLRGAPSRRFSESEVHASDCQGAGATPGSSLSGASRGTGALHHGPCENAMSALCWG